MCRNTPTNLILRSAKRVSKDGQQTRYSFPSFETRPAGAPQDEVALQRTCMHLLARRRERSRGMGFGAGRSAFSGNPREQMIFATVPDFVPLSSTGRLLDGNVP